MTRPRIPSLALVAAITLVTGCYDGVADEQASTGPGTTTAATTLEPGRTTSPEATSSTSSTSSTGSTGSAGSTGEPEAPGLGALGYTAEDAREYLAVVAPLVVGRLLDAEEENLIYHFGAEAIVPIIEAWVTQPAFAESVRMLMQVKLSASGSKDGVDYELPGNLAAHLARNDRPYSELLTADYCVDGQGGQVPCDTGAPYQAGVLTTRAYLLAAASRFNLRRARWMMDIFACLTYPMDELVQPRVNKLDLIPMFRALTAEEQTVPEAANGFGNGDGCYTCHGQFSAHAQLFVRFDKDGLWHADATGLQDPENELGRSINGLYTSHFVSPLAAPQEVSQLFNQPVYTLVDAARVLASGPNFTACAARHVLEYSFGTNQIDAALLADLAAHAKARDLRLRPEATGGPTFGDLFVVALTHPRVLQAVIGAPLGDPSDGGPSDEHAAAFVASLSLAPAFGAP